MNIKELFQRLDTYSSKVPVNDLTVFLSELEISFDDIQPFAHFGKNYRRNLMKEGKAYQALIICWKNGQRSPIHNHKGSSCALKIIKGVATETLFTFAPNDLIYPTSSEWLYEEDVTGSENDDIHQISNLQSLDQELITFHIYTPGLLHMDCYSLETNKVASFDDPVMIDGSGI